jgi:UDP-3-O-[3-hydroxymyristoyl] glucosamine N-acyltransferase
MANVESSVMMTVAELAELLGGRLIGSGEAVIRGVGAVDTATADQVTFLADEKHASRIASSLAAAVMVRKPIERLAKPQIVVADVDNALIAALRAFAPASARPAAGVHPAAVVAPEAVLGRDVSVGPHAVIASGVTIGDGTAISSGVSIGPGVRIGTNCRIEANVVIYHNCTIGNDVWIQANSTIGSTGFGYKLINGRHVLIPHNGGVVIEDSVDIGANCCIDRAKFGNTVIGAGTKIDNLVQIAHNVVVGRNCLIAAQVGVAGSTVLGDGVVVGGQSGFKDHIKVGDGTMVAARSGLMNDAPGGQTLAGNPATEIRQQLRQIAITAKLPQMLEQLKEVTRRIEALESAENDRK